MVPLSRAVGRKRALEMLLTGEPIDAATALEWGLVNRVVPVERSRRRRATSWWRRSPAPARSRSRIGKEAFYEQIELDEPGAYGCTQTVMAANAQAGDAQEGMGAFLEKRPPTWTGHE